MIYDPNNPNDPARAYAKIGRLLKENKRFEIKEKRPRRSINQNAYLHLILSWFAHEYGETLEYVKKAYFKMGINPHIFETEYVNPKTGDTRPELRSTSELDSKELTKAIENFRNWSAKGGIYLPEPHEIDKLNNLEYELQKAT